MERFIFWDITPCSPLKVNRCFGGTWRFHLLATCSHSGFLLNSFSTLKMEAIYASKTSVDFQRTTRRYAPEYRRLQTNFPLGSLVSVLIIPQAVIRWLPTAAARVRAKVIWDLSWAKWHWGRFHPSTSVSSANSHSTDWSTLIIYHPGLVGQLVADVASGFSLTPPQETRFLRKHVNKEKKIDWIGLNWIELNWTELFLVVGKR
jgi:hypothetical protein